MEKTSFQYETYIYKNLVLSVFCYRCDFSICVASHQHSDSGGSLLDGEPIATEQLDVLYVIVAKEAELDFT